MKITSITFSVKPSKTRILTKYVSPAAVKYSVMERKNFEIKTFGFLSYRSRRDSVFNFPLMQSRNWF